MAMNWCSSYSSSPSSSSGSFMNSSLGSELDFTESDSDKDDDYVAILTQQMAILMLQENDDDNSADNKLFIKPELLPGNRLQGIDNSSPRPLVNATKNDAVKLVGGSNKTSQSLRELDSWSKQALTDDQIKNNKKLARMAAIRPKKKSERKLVREPRNNIVGKTSGNKTPLLDGKADESRKTVSSTGTGVFLPKGTVYAPVPAEKASGGATVIIPARVAKALKVHFDKIGVPNSAVSLIQQDGYTGDVIYGLQLQHDDPRNKQPCNNPEKLLPQEWTY